MTRAEWLKNTHSSPCSQDSGMTIVDTEHLMADAIHEATHVEHDASLNASQYQFNDGSHLTIFHTIIVSGETYVESQE